jgi:hypothetical protein
MTMVGGGTLTVHSLICQHANPQIEIAKPKVRLGHDTNWQFFSNRDILGSKTEKLLEKEPKGPGIADICYPIRNWHGYLQ